MENETQTRQPAKPRKNKRVDYIVAIVINVIVLIIANLILSWGIMPFLTDSFKQVLPIFNASLSATVIANAIFLLFDPDWFTSLLRVGLNALAVAVAARFLAVFPFDFSAYPGFDWATLARVLLIIGIVGASIAILVEALKFLTAVINFIRRR